MHTPPPLPNPGLSSALEDESLRRSYLVRRLEAAVAGEEDESLCSLLDDADQLVDRDLSVAVRAAIARASDELLSALRALDRLAHDRALAILRAAFAR